MSAVPPRFPGKRANAQGSPPQTTKSAEQPAEAAKPACPPPPAPSPPWEQSRTEPTTGHRGPERHPCAARFTPGNQGPARFAPGNQGPARLTPGNQGPARFALKKPRPGSVCTRKPRPSSVCTREPRPGSVRTWKPRPCSGVCALVAALGLYTPPGKTMVQFQKKKTDGSLFWVMDGSLFVADGWFAGWVLQR